MVAVTPSASTEVAVTLPVKSPVTSPVTFPVTLPVTLPVKSPVTLTVILLGKPIVIVWFKAEVSISLAVPAIVND